MSRMQIFIGLLLLATGIRTEGQEGRTRLSGSENYARNRSGVVMIRTEYSANVYVNNMKMDQRAFNRLLDSIQKLDNGGGVLAEQKLDIVLKELNNNPARYIQTTFDYIKQPEQITATGTGFFLTGDGYVATNCHMIDRDNAFIRRQFILTAFRQITDANISALESSWATTFTDQQRSLLYETYSSVYSRLFSMVLYDLRKNIYVVYRSDRERTEPESVEKPASIIIKGQPMPGKDIAILKIETEGQMPVLPLAGIRLPEVGAQLFVYGYPGPVTHNDYVSAESAIEPTLTTGIVSAIKKSVNGWPVIQMDANINHGSSGGPVCNDEGEVVGLTTFGSIENTGGLAAGLNFAVPVAILDEYLDSAGISPRPSKASELFASGLYYFDRQYFGAALKQFEAVRKLNDGYPGIYGYIAECRNNLGKSRTSGPVENILLCIGAFIVLFGLIVWVKGRK
ncbi:MAG: trypsin-like peptidase domain-containing protein [Bacteroidota bacterium]|nr:trypsin-like peptidase domain-containing protein [Bacteroidota bacterium]MDP4216423.1 trypsin-like peptidase domain-containing protein [Bacteroidota bacterium]MDP4244567.1 trypsin-like peptidase domain-containing protein [Bacteroidota bacterium]MDP4257605.1 trypsin-like peptidase domain-containing protein [Bacteroidota bacterium]